MPVCAEVIVDISAEPVDKTFHYLVPPSLEDKLQTGHRVLVPFGPRRVEGYIIGWSQPEPDIQLKEIIKPLDQEPLLSEEMLTLAHWVAEEYNCYLVEAISCFLPPGIKLKSKRVDQKTVQVYRLTQSPGEWPRNLGPKQRQALEALAAAPENTLPTAQLRQLGVPYSSLKSLQQRGLVEEEQCRVRRAPQGQGLPVLGEDSFQPTEHQRRALEAIQGGEGVFLLHGVTGSGKTEVYLRAIAQTLRQGTGALVLTPEIALTSQIWGRFQERFPGQVALWHSNLSLGERYDEWHRIRFGGVPIVIGARSAVFAPLQNLGLIILDEEHEPTYKQGDRHPRYHARAVAIERARLTGAKVILGSATPSLESYHQCQLGRYTYLQLPQRIHDLPLPPVEIVDMRRELKEGNRSILSKSLRRALEETLRGGDQAILFLNRRGYTTFVLCRACGEVIYCPHCAVSMTYHQVDRRLRCHYCNYQMDVPAQCPRCRSDAIRHFGAGTQRVEEVLMREFPQARIGRLDADTTSRKGAHARILGAFQRGELDILVGTQMVAKGLDFPRVNLVGILAADMSLNLPDFRGGERTFQLLVQGAGRCGRAEGGAQVIIQTYNPEHYAIVAASRHDYTGFSRQELQFRRQMEFPPFCRLVRLVLAGEGEGDVIHGAELLARLLRPAVGRQGWKLMGPAPAPLGKLQDQYRWHLLLKVPLNDKLELKELLGNFQGSNVAAKVKLAVDVEPLSML
ncbi:MAG: replication restart helicase PriA [Limnochordia bacterium]|jgi:primosomal protein N' (replication factor Y)